ncbi:RNA polymerase II transcription elongation factor-domain-containing protein [Poronia punctata]|nr:RNA polymerase II transcription elongation factor-domain-containing protein [Poronia punctata]
MASLAAGIVDPTKAGKYRVVLSDALLGKEPKELYTGIRYNHKPSFSSPTAPHQARIKPTSSGEGSSYELSFQEDGGRYSYSGSRAHESSQCVLVFDPEREVFVLHRLDSMFNMNLVHTPSKPDAETLRDDYPQLEGHRPSRSSKPVARALPSSKSTKPKKSAPKELTTSTLQKTDPPKPAPATYLKKIHHDSEDESSDDDLLTIEDPGGVAPPTHRDFSPGVVDKPRRFSEFVQQHNEEEEDADGGFDDVEVEVLNDADGEDEEGGDEDDEDDDEDESEHFKLPSPITRQMMSRNINGNGGASHGMGSIAHSSQAIEEEISDEDEQPGNAGGNVAQSTVAIDDTVVDLEAALLEEIGEFPEQEEEERGEGEEEEEEEIAEAEAEELEVESDVSEEE